MRGVEGFDDEHGRATGFAAVYTNSGVFVVIAMVVRFRWYLQQQLLHASQVAGTQLVGEQAVVANAMKTWR